MSLFTHTYSVDLRKPLASRQTQALLLTQDANSDDIVVEVYDGGVAYTLTGTATAAIVRGDGSTVDAVPVISGNRMTLTLPAGAYAIPGVIMITMRETVDDEVDGETVTRVNALLNLTATVKLSETGKHIDPGTVMPSFNTLIQEIHDAMDEIEPEYTNLVEGVVRHDMEQELTEDGKAQARDNIGAADVLAPDGEVTIDKSGVSNSYIAATVGSAISIKSSGTSLTYREICRVENGKKYALYVLNADPAANTGSRVVCITDDEGIVLQKLNIATTAGRWNVLSFTAEDDGWLYVCVDQNYLKMKVCTGAVWELEKSLAPVEPSKATTAYATGKLLAMDGRLYQTTSAIAAGEDIVPGTNVAETTVAAQLAALEARIAALENA